MLNSDLFLNTLNDFYPLLAFLPFVIGVFTEYRLLQPNNRIPMLSAYLYLIGIPFLISSMGYILIDEIAGNLPYGKIISFISVGIATFISTKFFDYRIRTLHLKEGTEPWFMNRFYKDIMYGIILVIPILGLDNIPSFFQYRYQLDKCVEICQFPEEIPVNTSKCRISELEYNQYDNMCHLKRDICAKVCRNPGDQNACKSTCRKGCDTKYPLADTSLNDRVSLFRCIDECGIECAVKLINNNDK